MAYRPAQSSGSGFGFGGFNFTLTPWVKRLLIANAAVFLLMWIGGPTLRNLFVDWFAFDPGRLLTRPWGALTYMFVHGSFGHLFFNMLALFFFGPPLEQKWGSREFLKYYLICGMGGVALSFVVGVLPALGIGGGTASIIGASAAVYGVMLAFAMNWPDAPIYIWGIFPIKAKWLVGLLFVISFMSAMGGPGGNVAHLAHLGGFFAGLIYMKSDWRLANRLEAMRKASRQRRFSIVPRDEAEDDTGRKVGVGRGEKSGRGEQTAWGGKMRQKDEEALLDAVDRVLDKISESGIGSLTDDERRLLDEVSRRSRTN